MSQVSTLFEKHQGTLNQAIEAIGKRQFYTPYPEHPKAYGETGEDEGKKSFTERMNKDFTDLLQEPEALFIGEEVSPYLQLGLGIRYPELKTETLIKRSKAAATAWEKLSAGDRAGILIESLERVKQYFFEIAFATMHTTGQSFMMSFQASGPHANDRALEAIAMGYMELTRFPQSVDWVKNMGKFDLKVHKTWKAIAKGINLVIGCSTFPTWNTVPGMFAGLITGNTVIVKPHPKAILPIALVIVELQKVLKENNLDPNICQLAIDTQEKPITKQLAEHADVKLIDFTGSSQFGEYIESLPEKTVFTEKAGVNSCLIHSVKDIQAVVQNIAFSVSLYSGQMCTAPQNIFIPETGIDTGDGHISYEETVKALSEAITGLANHPKMGAGTLGGIQAEATLSRAQQAAGLGGKMLLNTERIANPEFENARVSSPALIELNSSQKDVFQSECFGPVVFVIKTKDVNEAIELMKTLALEKGAITCSAYTVDIEVMQKVEDTMNRAFTPVSFNFTGAIFVNQHAAFSDFHVTGGNPAGNASFTNPDYINRRFVWVGNRFIA